MDKQQWTKPQPMWLEDTSLPSFNELKEDTSADVAVIGEASLELQPLIY